MKHPLLQEFNYQITFDVRDYELDSEGIVNNAVYLHYLEYTRHRFCQDAGVAFGRLQAMGIVPVARRVEIDYHTPLRSGDSVVSALSLTRNGARFVFHQALFIAGIETLAAEAVVTIVCLQNGKPSRGDELAEYLSSAID